MKPLIGLPSDIFVKDGLDFHSVGDKYLRAIVDVAKCHPVIIPSLGSEQELDDLLGHFAAILMTGATSNVHPNHYGVKPTSDHEPYDEGRDLTSLRLIEKTLAREIPLLCICRGYQELNVVLGGTLETEIQTQPNRFDHRAPESDVLDVRYGPVHDIAIAENGVLHGILGKTKTKVNTVHRQAIGKIASGLDVEAWALDDTIEAVSVRGVKGFALGVQWHPEYKAAGNPDSVKLFTAFGDAARQYAAR